MINTYTHYGIDVSRQVIDTRFKDELAKAGIQYTELAISPSHDVIVYQKDGIRKYALVRPLLVPEAYCEAVYITTQTPDDCNWNNLILDVEAQYNGSAPAQRTTRLKMLINSIEQKMQEKDAESNNGLFNWDLPSSEIEELVIPVRRYLRGMGIDKSDIAKMEHYDVDESLYNKLLEV